ncbi:MBL fold metallo-hydrolase [Candidatus Parcubacteria bacterium]|nr:MBL fold metallo-hydrolase [Candidatus Parcubacteria bacterium]
MIVTYQGGEAFKISQGELSISVNPTNSRSASDITLISSSEFAGGGKGFIVNGPGEYEVKDIGIKGFLSKSGERINTIYMVSFEGMNMCFLGPLTQAELPKETKEHLEDIDILFVPVDTLTPEGAYKLAVSLEPSISIPMHYDKESLKKFLKEGGSEVASPLEKLVIKKKDLEGKEGEIIVLKEE